MTTITITMSRNTTSRNTKDPPSYEMSTLSPLPPGVADDSDNSQYTDISAIPDDSHVMVGLYPEVIVTADPNESFNASHSSAAGESLLRTPRMYIRSFNYYSYLQSKSFRYELGA